MTESMQRVVRACYALPPSAQKLITFKDMVNLAASHRDIDGMRKHMLLSDIMLIVKNRRDQ